MLLLEALLLAGITALMAGLLFPALSDWTEERRLDLAASEAATIIRSVQIDSRNGDARYPGTSVEYKELQFSVRNGQVRYICRRGMQSTPPTGYLPEGITMTPADVTLIFQKDNFAGRSDDYSFRLYGPRRTSARVITVSMYTGRVRVETVEL